MGDGYGSSTWWEATLRRNWRRMIRNGSMKSENGKMGGDRRGETTEERNGGRATGRREKTGGGPPHLAMRKTKQRKNKKTAIQEGERGQNVN